MGGSFKLVAKIQGKLMWKWTCGTLEGQIPRVQGNLREMSRHRFVAFAFILCLVVPTIAYSKDATIFVPNDAYGYVVFNHPAETARKVQEVGQRAKLNIPNFMQSLTAQGAGGEVQRNNPALEDKSQAAPPANYAGGIREAGAGSVSGQRRLPTVPAATDGIGVGHSCNQRAEIADQASGIPSREGL